MAKCTGVRCPMQYGYKVEECNHTDCPYRTEPITNGDRIRAMTDEELAKFIPNWSYTDACKCVEKPYVDCNNECEKCVSEWLQQPAEDL